MPDIECLKNSETKKYIIPTNEWLKPLKPLISSLNTKGKIILANMVNKKKVVVKITKNINFNKIKYISAMVKGLPNMPKIYCVFQCQEDEYNFDAEYLNTHGFCSSNPSESDPLITLEIMKLYKNKLSDHKHSLNINEIKPILKKLIFGLLNAFEHTGFIHGDLHIDNILINKTEEDLTLTYKIDKNTHIIKTNTEYIIMDFDKSTIYDTTYLKLDPFVREKTIIHSIEQITRVCGSQLYKKTKKWENDPINIAFDKIIENSDFDIIKHGTSLLYSYYTDSRPYKLFIKESILDAMYMINTLWKELYNEYLFIELTLEAYK